MSSAAGSFGPSHARPQNLMHTMVSGIAQTGERDGWRVALTAVHTSGAMVVYAPRAGRLDLVPALAGVAQRMASSSDANVTASYGTALPGSQVEMERRIGAAGDHYLATSLALVPADEPLPAYGAAQIAELSLRCAMAPCTPTAADLAAVRAATAFAFD